MDRTVTSYDSKALMQAKDKKEARRELDSQIGQLNSMGFVLPGQSNGVTADDTLKVYANTLIVRDSSQKRLPTKPDFRMSQARSNRKRNDS